MTAGNIIGVDLGGTSVVTARFSGGQILDQVTLPTGAERGAGEILSTLSGAIRRVMTKDVRAIGIGMPGLMDPDSGEVLHINNIPSLKGIRVKEVISEAFLLPVFQNNDANCFALGEATFGAARGYSHVVGITLGTGLGGGIVIGGKVHSGMGGGAGELGCLPFRDGIVEDYCSAAWLRKKYGSTGIELFGRARNGDREARGAFRMLGSHIGEFLHTVLWMLDPEAIVIGGSLSRAWEFLEEGIMEQAGRFPVEPVRDRVKILPAGLDNAGLYGAAALCSTQDEPSR